MFVGMSTTRAVLQMLWCWFQGVTSVIVSIFIRLLLWLLDNTIMFICDSNSLFLAKLSKHV